MQCTVSFMLGIEKNIKLGSEQRQAKEFALGGAVFDQKDDGCVTIIEGDNSREGAGLENE